MTGDRYNNRTGQVLLIVVMLLATVVTVVMTISFNSTSVSQVTKLEEDSQKALAAAEAGIEAAVKQNAGSVVSIADIGQFSTQGITGQAEVTTAAKPFYVTPLMQKDEQYTFYVSSYPALSPSWNGNLNLYFVSEAGGCPAIEIVIATNTNTLVKSAYNSCSPVIINASTAIATNTTIDETTFTWSVPTISVTDSKFMLVKVFGSKTKIGFRSENGTTLLPLQGKTIDSEARTQTGVTKRVVLFQSYPQIPASFFESGF